LSWNQIDPNFESGRRPDGALLAPGQESVQDSVEKSAQGPVKIPKEFTLDLGVWSVVDLPGGWQAWWPHIVTLVLLPWLLA